MFFRGSGVIMLKHPKALAVATIESFTRFQVAAGIDSSIHRFIESWLAGWLAGLLAACWLVAERMVRRRGSEEF